MAELLLPPNDDEIVRSAWEIIQNTAIFSFEQGLNVLNRELHGEGCGCGTCSRMAVDQVNWAAQFITPMGEDLPIIYIYNGKSIEQQYQRTEVLPDNWWLNIEGGE